MRSAGFLVAALLILVLILAFNPGVVRRLLLPAPAEAATNTSGKLEVWVNKRSGFYYCPGSRVYGTLRPGQFMTQDNALQTGFRPAPHVPCM
jgi:hypothetical protein